MTINPSEVTKLLKDQISAKNMYQILLNLFRVGYLK